MTVPDCLVKGSSLPLSRSRVMASSAICWPLAKFSGLPISVMRASMSTRRDLCNPSEAFACNILRTEASSLRGRNFVISDGFHHGAVRGVEIRRQ